MKKVISFVMFLAAMFTLVSCNEDSPSVDGGEFGVSTSPIQIGASDQIVSRHISVRATGEWGVDSTPEWVSVKDITADKFRIEVEPYLDGEQEFRQGVISVKMDEAVQEITIRQLVYIIPVVLEVAPETVANVWEGIKYSVEVTASHSWDVDTEADWITVSDIDETGFKITAADYGDLEDESRTGTVVVSMNDPGATKREITVIQPKPIEGAAPLSEYLGEYTLVGESGVGNTKVPYERTAEMVLRTDLGYNIISINALETRGGDLCFKYDPVTGVLSNYNYEYLPTYHLMCTIAYYAPIYIYSTRHENTAWIPVTEGEIQLTFNENGEIVLPQVLQIDEEAATRNPDWEIERTEFPVYIADFYGASGISIEETFVTNAKLVKNN